MNIPIVINDYSIKKEPDEESSQQIQENKLEQQRKLGREHSKECRGRKRLSSIKTFEHAICDTQIPGPSNGNPPLVIKNRRITIHNTITHRIFLLYSWLQKKTGTVRIKLTHFYNSFIV
jgi:hypothetical protein